MEFKTQGNSVKTQLPTSLFFQHTVLNTKLKVFGNICADSNKLKNVLFTKQEWHHLLELQDILEPYVEATSDK